jgi:hypothetical protein
MAKNKVSGSGTRQSPWVLKTPPGTSEFEAFRDETLDPPALIVQVGKTEVAISYVASTISTRC